MYITYVSILASFGVSDFDGFEIHITGHPFGSSHWRIGMLTRHLFFLVYASRGAFDSSPLVVAILKTLFITQHCTDGNIVLSLWRESMDTEGKLWKQAPGGKRKYLHAGSRKMD